MSFVILHDSCPNREGVTPSKIQSMLQSAFDLAQSESVPLACLVVQVDDLHSIAQAYGTAVVDKILSAIVRILESEPGMEDEMGFLFEDRFLLGIPGVSRESIEEKAGAILERTRELRVEVDGRAVPAKLSIGVASSHTDAFPQLDELLLDTLIQVAREGSQVANSSGGDKWVHTELYGLVQKSFERNDPDKIHAQRQRIASLRQHPAPPPAQAVVDGASPDDHPADVPTIELPPAPPKPRKTDKPVRPNGHPTDVLAERKLRMAAEEAQAAENKAAEPPPLPAAPTHSSVQPDAPVQATAEGQGPGEITELLRKVLGGARKNDIPESQRGLYDDLRKFVDAQKSKTDDESTGEYQSQIQILERRIHKLNEALSETESELGRVAKMKAIDPGVASAFRHVQGLGEEDSNFEAKKALMEEIFKANLRLVVGDER